MSERHSTKTNPAATKGLSPQGLIRRMGDILALEQAGKTAEAVTAARALAVGHPDRVETVRLAVDMALRAKNSSGPEAVAKALRAKHPKSLAAAYAASYVHFRRDNLAVARRQAVALANRFPANLLAAFLLAEICTVQADHVGAIACLEAMLPHHAGDGPLHHKLAGLYWLSAKPQEAAEFAQRATDLGVALPANARLLGAALCQLDRHDEAVLVLQKADAGEPEHFETLALLSVARLGAGDKTGAMTELERALDIRPFSVRGPSVPGRGVGLTVMVIEFASPAFFARDQFTQYHFHNYVAYLTAPDLRMVYVPLTPGTVARLSKSNLRPDVIVNNMAVQEAVHDNAIDHYRDLVAVCGAVPVVNPAEAIAQCGREENSRKFEAETGFIFPKTRRTSPSTMSFDQILAEVEADLSWPVLVRPTHTNIGEGLSLIDGPDALRDKMDDMGLNESFVVQYHECRNADGIARQHRAVVIGDEINVDRVNTYPGFQSHDNLRREPIWQERGYDKVEQAFIADPDGFLNFEWKTVFAPLLAQTPLDIYGFDFAVTRDGHPIVFEVNAAMNLFNIELTKWSPYLAEHYRQLNDKVVRYLRTRANNAA